jgi:hypothetical protein
MDMRTNFIVRIEDNEHGYTVETWQDALDEFLTHCQQSGFTIDEKRKRQIIELAKFGRVTV